MAKDAETEKNAAREALIWIVAPRFTALARSCVSRRCRPILRWVAAATIVISLSADALSDDGDDTLAYYLARSDLVLAGEVATEPSAVSSEVGVIEYGFKIEVADVLRGDIGADALLAATIIRFESDARDRLVWLRKGAKAIFFLRQRPELARRGYVSADPWFAAQPYNAAMAKQIRQLAAQVKKTTSTALEGVVLSFKDQRAELSLGADDGVASGELLYWYRAGELLGRLRVTAVDNDTAAAEILTRLRRQAGPPRRNDRVVPRSPP